MPSKTYRIVLWSSVIGALVLVVGGLVWLAGGGGQKVINAPGVNEIVADDHVFGKADAAVTFVEYADFQCPACSEYYPIIKKLEEDYGDRMRFVYRNFPIPGHVNGIPAARAAEAAALQGKFFEMEDKLFTNQKIWSLEDAGTLAITLALYAQAIGLDMNKFQADKDSDAVKAKIDKDAQSGVKAGVDATPTFFLNGVQIRATSYDEFAKQFDQALGK
jgi:protein-disulfide isomerase